MSHIYQSLENMSKVGMVFELISSNRLDQIKQNLTSISSLVLLEPINTAHEYSQLTWDASGGTVLHIKGLSLPVLRFLLKHMETHFGHSALIMFINTTNSNYDTALHVAARSTNIDMLKLLLNYGADPYARNCKGQTTLHCAISYNRELQSESSAILCVFALIEAGQKFRKCFKNVPLLQSIENEDHETALNFARKRNESNIVQALNSCLQKSIVENHLFDLVISARRKPFPNAMSEKTISNLSTYAGGSIIDEEDANGMTIVHLASEAGLANTLEYIFKYLRVNLSCKDNKGRTALHYAAKNGLTEDGQSCIEILLQNDKYRIQSTKNMTDENGQTALEIALGINASKACELMLKHGCDIYTNNKVLLNIYKTMPQSIGEYLDTYGAYISRDGHDLVLYYSFSAITGLSNHKPIVQNCELIKVDGVTDVKYECLASNDSTEFQEEAKYLVHALDSALENKAKVLSHPLIKLFLHQKWQKFKHLYYVYLVFYFLFLILYSWYTIYIFAVECPIEAGTGKEVVRVKRDFYASHYFPEGPPRVWSRDPKYWTTIKTPTTTKLNAPSTDRFGNTPSTGPAFSPLRIIGIVLALPVFLILSKVCVQIQHRHKHTFRGYLTTFYQLIIPGILIFNCVQSCTAYIGMGSWRYILAWIGIFFAWVNSMDEVGKIPSAGKFVSVFKCVTVRSLVFMLPFIPLIAAFTFAFKIMMPQNKRFKHISTSAVTLMAFMIGELEYDDFILDIKMVSAFPAMAIQLFFAVFIFIVPLVLANLLIGVAVNEISLVIKYGGVDFRCRQLQDIYMTERALLWISRKLRYRNWLQRYFVAQPGTTFVQRDGVTKDFYCCTKIPEKFKLEIQKKCGNLHLKPTEESKCETSIYLKENIYSDDTWWRHTNTTKLIPEGCLVGGIDHGVNMHIIRAHYAGGIIPGKHTEFPRNSFAWISYAGVEVKVYDFQILKISSDAVSWEKVTQSAPLPHNAMIGGISSDGEDLLIGRTAHEGTVTVGKVEKRSGVLRIPYDGREITYAEFEILCYTTLVHPQQINFNAIV